MSRQKKKFLDDNLIYKNSEMSLIVLLSLGLALTIFSSFIWDLKVLLFSPFFAVPIAILSLTRHSIKESKQLKEVVEKYLAPFNKGISEPNLEATLKRVLQAIELSYVLIPSATRRGINKNESVQKVIEAIQHSISPQAIRITLKDSESELSARRYLVGYPRILSSDEDAPYDPSRIRSLPLSFGGKIFGALDLEFNDISDQGPDFDLQLGLVSAYCSILLMNDEFSKELVRLRSLSEETLRTKTGFLATLSHEIRGPLGVILNSVELISDGLCGDVTQMQKDTLKMVKKSSTHLMDLVNDVLDYAKIESGSLEVKTAIVPLRDILNDIAAIVRSQAVKKHQKLIVERAEDRLGVECDKRHLRQILINLLTNAVKYTPDGGSITLSAEEVELGVARIYVKDTGVGIPADQFSRVFAPFERVDDEYSSKQNGTGLGMALTRRLVEGNGGLIDFDSEVGKGSQFWVDLPSATIEKIVTEEHDGTAVKVGRGEELLLLEPDQEQRIMFSKSLEQRGFKVDAVGSAAEAISFCRKKVFMSMIVETDLPDFDAYELIQNIRSIPSSSRMPIVVMSGKAFLFDVEHYLKLGVDRCLSKPFSLAELAATLRRLLDEVVNIEESSNSLPQIH